MRKIIISIIIVLFAMNAIADRILWLDIRGDLSTVGSESFSDYFERTAALLGTSMDYDTGGADIFVVNSAGQVIDWTWPGGMSGKYGVSINSTGHMWDESIGDYTQSEYPYSLRALQVDVTSMAENETVSLMAGIFNWDAVDWDTFDESVFESQLFTPLAYTSATISDLDECIFPGGVAVPANFWTPTVWNAVPEPSTAILALLGVGMLLKRRK